LNRRSECQDVTIGPGDYLVFEFFDQGEPTVFISGDCTAEGLTEPTGNIQAGETQVCAFDNQPITNLASLSLKD